MKIHSVVSFLSASVLSAADLALPSFSEKLLDRPELSLSESARSGQLLPSNPEAKVTVEMIRKAPTGQKRLVSRMPIIEPSAVVDRNMPVVAPRQDIDLKLIVKEPSVESVK